MYFTHNKVTLITFSSRFFIKLVRYEKYNCVFGIQLKSKLYNVKPPLDVLLVLAKYTSYHFLSRTTLSGPHRPFEM